MINLTDVLAANRPHSDASTRSLMNVLNGAPRRTEYQMFQESRDRGAGRVDESPAVVWAKRDLQATRTPVTSPMSGAVSEETK